MEKVVGSVATALGLLVRFVLLTWAPAMRLAGFTLVCFSVWQFDPRVSYGFAGACLFIFTMQHRPRGRG